MKIYLVTNGQTDANIEGILEGRSNRLSLNDIGIRSIKKIKEKLKEKPLDIAFTSPLIRCWETAIIIAGDRALIQQEERLTERDLGEYEGQKKEEYNQKKYWDYRLNTDEKKVEKIQDVIARCESFLDEILQKHEDQSVLIVAHESIILILHHLLHQTDFKKEKNLLRLKVEDAFFEEVEITQKRKK